MTRRTAYHLLARRDHAQLELINKLTAKKHASEHIQKVVTELLEKKYLDDARFCELYLSFRRKKGFGPLKIAFELQNKGVAKNLIADAFNIHDNAWVTDAANVWQKYFQAGKPLTFEDKAKQSRFLQNRGFTHEQIEQVFKVVVAVKIT